MSRFHFMAAASLSLLLASSLVKAQELSIHHGFLFFADEKYTMDEETFKIYEEGHAIEQILKEYPAALEKFKNYQGWHTTALVSTGLSIAAFAFGGVYYIFEKDLSEKIGESAGLVSFATGGGLLVLGLVFEFIAWGSISSAADIYNHSLMDESAKAPMMPSFQLSFSGKDVQAGLTFRF